MARATPSAAALPDFWHAEMDRFICHCEALGDVDTATMIRGVKKKYHSELDLVILEEEAIEKRIACLELRENDYFKEGMRTAVDRMEKAGYILPSMHHEGHTVKDGRVGLVASPFCSRVVNGWIC